MDEVQIDKQIERNNRRADMFQRRIDRFTEMKQRFVDMNTPLLAQKAELKKVKEPK